MISWRIPSCRVYDSRADKVSGTTRSDQFAGWRFEGKYPRLFLMGFFATSWVSVTQGQEE